MRLTYNGQCKNNKSISYFCASRKYRKNLGFAIISAIFVLVILSLISTFLINLFINTQASSNILLLGQRAYFAAQSGLEWGLTKVAANPTGPCPTTTNININQGGILGFTAVVSCSKSGTTFTITSVASRGVFGAFEYVTNTAVGTYG